MDVGCFYSTLLVVFFRTTVFDERYVDDKVKMIKKASKMVRKRMKSVTSPERVSPIGNFQVLRAHHFSKGTGELRSK